MSQLVSSLIDPEIVEKQKEYMIYIEEHCKNVYDAWTKLMPRIPSSIVIGGKNIYDIIDYLKQDVQNHDNSKMSNAEFDAYRRKYYPTTLESRETDEFVLKQMDDEAEEAWFHHYTNNDHHPAYWTHVDTDGSISREAFKPIDMDYKAILHMICDWEAMSMKFGGNTIDWWLHKAKKERENMSEATLKNVEELLRYCFDFNGEYKYDE